jgi:hypothetical protein
MSLQKNKLQNDEEVFEEDLFEQKNKVYQKTQSENEFDYYKINIKEAVKEVVMVINF